MKKVIILVSALVVMSSFFQLGTIRRKKDPIQLTQSEAVPYQQKMEEESKDGPKGAPAPSFNLYPKARFLTDPAVGDPTAAQRVALEEQNKPSEAENVPEVAEVSSGQESEDWWSEEDEKSASEEESLPEEDANPEEEARP